MINHHDSRNRRQDICATVITDKGRPMKHRTRCLIGTVIAMILFSGCYQVSHYTGDGRLIDNGSSVATDRYVLNLGTVDLTQTGKTPFQIANLPAANFVVGLEITVTPENSSVIEKKGTNPVIALELSDREGNILIKRKAPLDLWTWAVRGSEHRAFVYGREEPGTYFDAVPKMTYTLTLSVLESDRSQSKYSALLIAKSGGWK